MTSIFAFPNPVNEKVARTVAAQVLVLAVATLLTGAWWMLAVLAAGFALRVAFGPRVSPIALLASRVIAPRLGTPRWVSGPPKRFAQAIGLLVTGAGAIAALAFDATTVAAALTLLIVVAASLEAVFSFCIGCRMFALFMHVGLIPERVCEACNSLPQRA